MYFKAGDYYVGDLCYVLSDEDYHYLLYISVFSNNMLRWQGEFNGYPLFVAPTSYGDGVYVDDDGDEYFVDSGRIGIVPVEMINPNKRADLGQIISFETDFEVYYDDGIFIFGDLVIDTKNFGIGAMLARHIEEKKGENV